MQPHKYHIHLNSQEKQTLRQLKRTARPSGGWPIGPRFILWTADWVAVDDISARLGLHRITVIFWRQRFVEDQQQGQPVVEHLHDRPPRGGQRSSRPPRWPRSRPSRVSSLPSWNCPSVASRSARLRCGSSRLTSSRQSLWAHLALVAPGCHSPLLLPRLALPTRSRFRGESQRDPGDVSAALARPAARPARLRALGG